MRRQEKKSILDLIQSFKDIHDELKGCISHNKISDIQNILSVCQDAAIKIGTSIEKSEGEGTTAVQQLEAYCEAAYLLLQKITEMETIDSEKEIETLQAIIDDVEEFIRNKIVTKSEIVFFPYKASMWDSLESIWRASLADPRVKTYVVPIPYFDRNPDGTAGEMHYEGDLFPDDVPVVSYLEYDVKKHHPDAAYIHNPYDEFNYVTTVDPHYYSHELKKYVDILVYVPYYATSGGMSEAQASLSAYQHADYIVAQAPLFKCFFDASVPDEKLIYMGSPKFDRVIRMCKNPGKLSESWEVFVNKRNIYFYNTSLGGMLENTELFLKKMNYVFETFLNHPEACLLWRPHPLLESTFKSMRPEFYQEFLALKEKFISDRIGIYDDTPDITETISHSYAYIGDGGTSVISLFGIAGKPIFLFNNNISEVPKDEYLQKGIEYNLFPNSKNHYRYLITAGNKLFGALEEKYKYKFLTELSDYIADVWYTYAVENNGYVYCCGFNAQDIAVVKDGKVVKRIELKNKTSRSSAFYAFHTYRNCIYLIPDNYDSIVKYDTKSDKVTYYDGYKVAFNQNIYGQHLLGGTCIYKNYLLLSSPTNHDVLAFDMNEETFSLLTTDDKPDSEENTDEICGSNVLVPDEKDGSVWFLPYAGTEIRRWYPESGKMQVYNKFPLGFRCIEYPGGNITNVTPFSYAAISDRYVVLSPAWGNTFLKLDKNSGEISTWKPGLRLPDKPISCYYDYMIRAVFLSPKEEESETDNAVWLMFSYYDRTLYKVNIDKDEMVEVPITFDIDEFKQLASGFGRYSQELRYCIAENVFNSLSDFLEGNTLGAKFDRDAQIKAYNEIASNNDGTCGEKVHKFIKEKLEEQL